MVIILIRNLSHSFKHWLEYGLFRILILIIVIFVNNDFMNCIVEPGPTESKYV